MREKKTPAARFPCHCCHKKDTVQWNHKRQCFICSNCLKSFDREVISKRHGSDADQLTLC